MYFSHLTFVLLSTHSSCFVLDVLVIYLFTDFVLFLFFKTRFHYLTQTSFEFVVLSAQVLELLMCTIRSS